MLQWKFMEKKVNFTNTILFCIVGTIIIIFLFSLPHLFQKKPKTQPKTNKKVYHEKKIRKSTISASIRLPIIMYHYVEYVKDKGDTIRQRENVNPATFEWQVKTLKENGYKFYFVKDVPQLLKNDRISSRAAVITFDDGYRDFYTDAFPILKKYQVKSTVYVICDFIGGDNFMTEQQLKNVVKSGLVEIGAHTSDHLYLESMLKPSVEEQIATCKKDLETILKKSIETFAYPYGAFSQETVNEVKKASFSAAVSVIPGIVQSENNLFYLYRIRPGIITGVDILKTLDSY